MILTLVRICGLVVILAVTRPASAVDTERPDVRGFIDEMVAEHGFARDEITALLAAATIEQSIIDAISRPAEKTKPWHEYRKIFVTAKRIAAGAEFWAAHERELDRISRETGVPIEILVGIIGVETYFGRITGSYRVLDALATLAFAYPPRADFFRRELAEFLLLIREENFDVDAARGSYAGAMGAPQFIPSSYRAYAIDADGNGGRDLWNSWSDVIGSVANYFVAHGWRKDGPVTIRASLDNDFVKSRSPQGNGLKLSSSVAKLRSSGVSFDTSAEGGTAATLIRLDGRRGDEYWIGFHNFYVITRYNRSVMYALAVWQLGQAIAEERMKDAA